MEKFTALSNPCRQAYSVRQLSPFQGTVQVLKGGYARALSADGLHWQIQVSCEVHQQEWGIMNRPEIQRRYVMFGMWNPRSGLASLPLEPTLDVPSASHIQKELIDHLQECVRNLPFPQKDIYEFWALDSHDQPLALLASAVEEHSLEHIEIRRWRALADRSQPFRPQRAEVSTDPSLKLEQLIHRQARSPMQAQWFRRDADGDACDLNGKRVNSAAFPALLIREDWEDPFFRLLCEDYHDWMAPRLLMLQNIDDRLRERLELAAQRRAPEASRFHGLYPKIMNRKILNRILVEARLRQSAPTDG